MAATKKSKGQTARRVAGLLLHRDEEGGWNTEDGRFSLYKDPGFTRYCGGPHPTRDGYCEGDEPHKYTAWAIWDKVRDDYIDREADDYASLSDAAARVKDWYAGDR